MGPRRSYITMEDPKLAEAARFVPSRQMRKQPARRKDNAEARSTQSLADGDEFSRDVPAQSPLDEGAQTAQADASSSETAVRRIRQRQAGISQSKRRKKSEKPLLVTKPGEVVVTAGFTAAPERYPINGSRGSAARYSGHVSWSRPRPRFLCHHEQGRIRANSLHQADGAPRHHREAAGVTNSNKKTPGRGQTRNLPR